MSIRSILVSYFFRRSDRKRDKGLKTPNDIKRIDDILYGPNETWHKLDVYFPKNSKKKLPVIINIHGGGWVYGTKETYQFYGMNLAQRGFLVINFTYRLAPHYKFPAQLEDVNRVIGWMYEHHDIYQMDLDHVYLIGDSAGAHLATLYTALTINEVYQQKFTFRAPMDFKPNAIALNCGIYDLKVLMKTDPYTGRLFKDLLGRRYTPKDLALIDPVTYITKDFPPVYVMTASHDFLKDQAPLLVNALTEHQIEHTYELYSSDQMKLQHVFHVDVRNPNADICNNDECDFFKKY